MKLFLLALFKSDALCLDETLSDCYVGIVRMCLKSDEIASAQEVGYALEYDSVDALDTHSFRAVSAIF